MILDCRFQQLMNNNSHSLFPTLWQINKRTTKNTHKVQKILGRALISLTKAENQMDQLNGPQYNCIIEGLIKDNQLQDQIQQDNGSISTPSVFEQDKPRKAQKDLQQDLCSILNFTFQCLSDQTQLSTKIGRAINDIRGLLDQKRENYSKEESKYVSQMNNNNNNLRTQLISKLLSMPDRISKEETVHLTEQNNGISQSDKSLIEPDSNEETSSEDRQLLIKRKRGRPRRSQLKLNSGSQVQQKIIKSVCKTRKEGHSITDPEKVKIAIIQEDQQITLSQKSLDPQNIPIVHPISRDQEEKLLKTQEFQKQQNQSNQISIPLNIDSENLHRKQKIESYNNIMRKMYKTNTQLSKTLDDNVNQAQAPSQQLNINIPNQIIIPAKSQQVSNSRHSSNSRRNIKDELTEQNSNQIKKHRHQQENQIIQNMPQAQNQNLQMSLFQIVENADIYQNLPEQIQTFQ
ncbi:UNKNOWN [Stylonychia lemnae]|uniref:Uncharacterized protein n=1 Tax=Stylonychia lemnae TaxID=5949 RepID=A0A078B1R8_STYLE|nr:UNKNOWN [Stylonychia lemnae]|eukprot:CDW87228.1 UNKNOWN [Stylonychia lemnae]